MAVDIAVSWQLPVVLATSPGLRRPPVLLVLTWTIRGGKLQTYQQSSLTIEHCSLPTGKLSWGGRIHHRQPKTNQCPTSNQSPVVHYERQV